SLLRYRTSKDPPANPTPWSFVYQLLKDNPEILPYSTSRDVEEAPETVPSMASNRSLRQTLPEAGSARLNVPATDPKAEEPPASMVPVSDAAARSRSRILR